MSEIQTPVRRPACTRCLRAERACICHWVAPVAPDAQRVEVLILQHPLEVHNAKNSARLLHLCLPRSRLVVGEVFHDARGLTAPFASSDAAFERRSLLLYPDTPLDQAPDLAPAPPLTPAMLCEPARLRLIVLDATWRKSRKMLYLNPALQKLPRLALRDLPASAYAIRKARRADQWSTLEATCAALAQLEGDSLPFEPVLRGFDGFVAQQLAYRPARTGGRGAEPASPSG